MVDNIKNAPLRTLTHLIGHSADGKGGRQPVEELLEGLVASPGSAVAGNVAMFSDASGGELSDSGVAISVVENALATCDLLEVSSPVDLDAMQTKLSGISTGADVTSSALLGLSVKASPDDADYVGLIDSADGNDLKSLSWANVKASLKSFFDAIYGALATANQWLKPQRASVKVLTSGSTVSIDAADGNDYSLPLAHNATLSNFANAGSYINMKGSIIVEQTIGGNTISFDTGWEPNGSAVAPSAPTALGDRFAIDFHIVDASTYRFNLRGIGV